MLPRALSIAILACMGVSVGAVAVPGQAAAFCRASTATRANGPCQEAADVPLLYWERGCFSYVFHPNVFEGLSGLSEVEIRKTFQRSFDTWQAVDCGYVPFIGQQSPELAVAEMPEFLYDEPNESIVTALTPSQWQEIEPAQPTSAFAITFLWHDTGTGELLDVDLALNLDQGPFGDCGATACADRRTVDLENTITHEAGHAMGLGHATDGDATMFPDAMPGAIFMRDLTVDDQLGLCAIELPSHDCGGSDGDVACMCPPAPIIPSVIIREGGCLCRLGPTRPLPAWSGLVMLLGLCFGARRLRRRARPARAR